MQCQAFKMDVCYIKMKLNYSVLDGRVHSATHPASETLRTTVEARKRMSLQIRHSISRFRKCILHQAKSAECEACQKLLIREEERLCVSTTSQMERNNCNI